MTWTTSLKASLLIALAVVSVTAAIAIYEQSREKHSDSAAPARLIRAGATPRFETSPTPISTTPATHAPQEKRTERSTHQKTRWELQAPIEGSGEVVGTAEIATDVYVTDHPGIPTSSESGRSIEHDTRLQPEGGG